MEQDWFYQISNLETKLYEMHTQFELKMIIYDNVITELNCTNKGTCSYS